MLNNHGFAHITDGAIKPPLCPFLSYYVTSLYPFVLATPFAVAADPVFRLMPVAMSEIPGGFGFSQS